MDRQLAADTLAFLESIEWIRSLSISSYTCISCGAVEEIRDNNPPEWEHAPGCKLKALIDRYRVIVDGTQ